MKKTIFSLVLLLLLNCFASAQTCTAVGIITLNPGGAGPIGAHVMVTYNPLKNLYYWNAGGFASNPIATYSSTGGQTLAVGMGNQDWRGLWWNSNTNSLEGNCFNSIGIFSVSTDPISGYALNGSSIIASNNQPGTQSGGQYDPVNDQVIYLNAMSIHKYSRASGNLVSITPIIGLPGGVGNINSNGFFTGINGMEYAIYDYTNRRAYYINYNTGMYVSTVQFPLSAGAPSSFGISYANGLFFIYDNTNWVGYRAGIWANHSAPVCIAQSVTLNAQGASTYPWNTGSNSNSLIINPNTSTVYTVSGNVGSGCVSTFTLSVPVIPSTPPIISISGNTMVCGIISNTLIASGASTYTWNNGTVNASIVINPTVNTTYTVIGSSSLACVSTQTINVSAGPSPTVTIAGNQNLCEGQSTTLTASGAMSYSWNTGNTSSALASTPSVSLIYTVVGTSTNSCTHTRTVAVNVSPLPTVSIVGPQTVCEGKSISITGTGASNYTWNTGSNAASLLINPAVNTTYSIVGTSSAGCSGTAITTVSVLVSPTLSIVSSATAFCEGNSVTMTASGSDTYSWSTGANTSSIIESPQANIIYTVIGTSTANSCWDSKTISITVFPKPIISINSPTILCLGESITLTVNGANTYTWFNGSNSIGIIDSPTITTNYSVSGTSTQACVGSASINVIVTICNSITENKNEYFKGVYPNPNKGLFEIKGFSEGDYVITDIEGRILEQDALGSLDSKIDLRKKEAGIYFLRIYHKNKMIHSTKLVLVN